MSKNFEDAYKAEVQLNIPDLWNRIESNLPEKAIVSGATPDGESSTVAVEEMKNQNVKKASVQKVSAKKKSPYGWMKWASLAAACLLFLMVIPAVIGIGALGLATNDSAETAVDMEMNAAVSQESQMEFADTDGMKYETNEDYFLEEGAEEAPAENEIAVENAGQSSNSAGGMESDVSSVQGSPSAENESKFDMYDTGYYEPVVNGLYAEVTFAAEEEGYYRAKLEFSELSRMVADEHFEGSMYYQDGILSVIIFTERSEVPVVGGKYSVDVYDINIPWASFVQPYAAELEE